MKTLNSIVPIIIFVSVLCSCAKNEYSPVVADQEFNVEENASTGTIVGAIEAFDPDEGQIISYEIIDGNSDSVFQINPVNGIIRVYNSEKLNYEECIEYSLTVVVSDNYEREPKESSSKVRISVIDINEFSPEVGDTIFAINENQKVGFEIGKIDASDGDIYQELIFSITSATDSGFVLIDSITGMLYVNDSAAIDYETRKEIVMEVQVRDNQEPVKNAVATIRINVLDVLEITDGLVAYYPFDGDASDASGNGHHGIINGPVLTQDRNGNSESAYLFDGIDDIISVQDHNSLSFMDQHFSISAWFISYELGNKYILYKGSNLYNREYSLGINPNNLITIAVFNNGSGYEAVGTPSTTVLKEGQWIHSAGTWDGQYLSIYINGKLENKLEIDVVIDNFSSDLFIGAYGGRIAEYAFNGVIDEIYIHNRVLGEDEILTLSDSDSYK